MAISDLVICRSGASTLSELITLEKPSIMIPYDFVGQKYNANILKKIGGAYVYKNDEIEVAFEKALSIIENENVLKVMKDNIKKIKKTDVIEKILKNLDIWR